MLTEEIREQKILVFDSLDIHTDDNGNTSAAGTAVLLKFESLSSLESYIELVYYANYSMTLYFEIEFIRVSCTLYARKKNKIPIKSCRNNSTVKKFHQEIRQTLHYTCIVCHHCFCLHYPVTSFNGKIYVYETCHKHLLKM